ncbi:MAG: hypothetical protein GXY58_07045 [Planctomycetaceae bacterium]|nr:hypothetical protein [Planctomycetaceae bacterium]
MSATEVASQLRDFTQRLIEQTGGIIDWPADQPRGTALVPEDIASSLGQRGESFPVALSGLDAGLSVDLGGEFLDAAARTLATFVPAHGVFALPSLPVKKSSFQSVVDQAFGWQNARCSVLQGVVTPIVYHTWWFHVTLRSEDIWETLAEVTVNCDGRTCCSLDGLLDAMDLQPVSGVARAPDTTLEIAASHVQQRALLAARPFLNRMEQRLERDRQRLRQYYRALSREAAAPNRRVKTAPCPEQLAARQRAVTLELQRKLAELEERYAFDGVVRPAALAEFRVPGLAIDVRIQRKAATRTFRLFWNGIQKRLEPLRCSRCGQGAYNLWFTNDEVEPICIPCHDA